MSSAFYPQGMNTYNNRVPQGGYESWKGSGVFSNPVGITSGNLRPLTNKDPSNDAIYKFGLPRPLKWQYRRGISVPVPIPNQDPSINNNLLGGAPETYYYSNREVKSSIQDRMVGQLMDQPGRFTVKNNNINEVSGIEQLDKDCKTCNGIGIVSSWYPINNLTEKPQSNVTNPLLCCNQQRKARRRVLPANTNLPKTYFTTNSQYLFNRCQTFDQRSFNFVKGTTDPVYYDNMKKYPYVSDALLANSKPGDPLSGSNLYVANCNPNFEIVSTVNLNIIENIAYILLNEGIITSSEYDNYKNSSIYTIEALVAYINTLSDSTKEKSLAIVTEIINLNSINNNNSNGSILHGPSNPKGCKTVEYKPNNPQFAKQGAVSSSTRILKLNVTTIEKNAASIKNNKSIFNDVGVYKAPNIPFIYKSKVPYCNPGLFTKNGNPKTCFRGQNDYTNKDIYDPSYSFGNVVNQLSDMSSIIG
jgi:hypothetical protein